jgi:hypothetical protein
MIQESYGEEAPCRPAVDGDDNTDPAPLPSIIVERFQEEIRALGGFWLFLGIICVLGLLLASVPYDFPEGAVFATAGLGLGIPWIVLGAMTLRKKMAAVYMGLLLTDVLMAICVLTLNICGVAILAASILQAHRVIRWAKQMRQAGIPLTAKPAR